MEFKFRANFYHHQKLFLNFTDQFSQHQRQLRLNTVFRSLAFSFARSIPNLSLILPCSNWPHLPIKMSCHLLFIYSRFICLYLLCLLFITFSLNLNLRYQSHSKRFTKFCSNRFSIFFLAFTLLVSLNFVVLLYSFLGDKQWGYKDK